MNYRILKSQKELSSWAILGFITVSLACPFSISHAEEAEEWTSSQPLLAPAKMPVAETTLPYLQSLRGLLVRSLLNIDNAKAFAELQSSKGTKPIAFSEGILLPKSMANPASEAGEVRSELTKTLARGVQKETKIADFVPKELLGQLSFNIGGKKTSSASRPLDTMRYGLILKDIEPSDYQLKLASINSRNDYEMLPYAGKADLRYEIGPLYPESDISHYSSQVDRPQDTWFSSMTMPKMEFNGKFTPAGLPGPGNPLPPQILTIDQVQGYYSIEGRIAKSLDPETLIHRFRVPLYQSLAYREERSKNFKITKMAIDNIYSNHGFSCNLEDFTVEKRYQAGLIYGKDRSRVELYAHIPKTAFEHDFWPQHRWELKLETSF